MARARQFWFAAEGERRDGSTRRFHVYTGGKKTIYVVGLGEHWYEHLCHPSVRMNERAVRHEIELVFEVKVTKIEHPEVVDRRDWKAGADRRR